MTAFQLLLKSFIGAFAVGLGVGVAFTAMVRLIKFITGRFED